MSDFPCMKRNGTEGIRTVTAEGAGADCVAVP